MYSEGERLLSTEETIIIDSFVILKLPCLIFEADNEHIFLSILGHKTSKDKLMCSPNLCQQNVDFTETLKVFH